MSGFVVGFGRPSREDVEAMFGRIGHRGRSLGGIWEERRAVLAQNYGSADLVGDGDSAEVPYGDSGRLRICYDGQMGNWATLAAEHGVADGPFRQERLLLELYRKHGSEMLRHLGDTIFALVISDGEKLFAARDVLGIKTLFYGRENGMLYLASELKSLRAVTGDIREFPEGHFMNAEGKLTRFAELSAPPAVTEAGLGQIIEDVRDIIGRSVRNRVDFARPTAALLSGGMDSSVISYLSSRLAA